jgi:flagellar basal-body rod protein FlgF
LYILLRDKGEKRKMIVGIYDSAAGMLVQQKEQDVIANNIANVNTAGFKRLLSVFQEKPEEEMTKFEKREDDAFYPYLDEQVIGKVGKGVLVQKTFQNFKQGAVQQTGNDFDFAINGSGFFAVEGADKKIHFTRNGEFTLNQKGELVTQQGYRVLGVSGGAYEDGMEAIDKNGKVLFPLEPIVLNNVNRKVTVDETGKIYSDGEYTGMDLSTFRIKNNNLIPAGENLFSASKGTPVLYSEKEHILQGYIEQSNVNSVKEMVKMIEVMRAYEFNQKLIRTQDDTLGKLIARISIR